MLTLTNLPNLPPPRGSGFARVEVETRRIKEYQYVNTKLLFPPIWQVPGGRFGRQTSLKWRALQYETPDLTMWVARWGRFMGWGLAQVRNMKLSMRKSHFDRFGRPRDLVNWRIWKCQWGTVHFDEFGRPRETVPFDQFGRPLVVGLGTGAHPTEEQENANDVLPNRSKLMPLWLIYNIPEGICGKWGTCWKVHFHFINYTLTNFHIPGFWDQTTRRASWIPKA